MSVYSKIDLKGADGGVYDGSVTNRFDRDYVHMATTDTADRPDHRKGRQLDNQTVERQGRLYVDRETLVSATGQDAQLEVNAYGATKVGVASDVKPVGAVDTDQEAIDAKLVPDHGQHVVGYEPPVTEPDPEVNT